MLAVVALLGGCKVMTREEAAAIRARDGGAFDAEAYVRDVWARRALPALRGRAVPLPALAAAARQGPSALEHLGRRASEGSPLTVVVSGEGVVQAVDRASPKGRLTLDGGAMPVVLQLGPVVSGTAVRDALPFVGFDAVPDQIAFARLGSGLTERALAPVRPVLARARPGERLRFMGAGPWRGDGGPLVLTPIAVEVLR